MLRAKNGSGLIYPARFMDTERNWGNRFKASTAKGRYPTGRRDFSFFYYYIYLDF